ncbi:MAG TPA: DUF1501 domain-containing protein [Chitinophagaceae bacterium]|nr:DUF1501 domain-containing protein [Chitinophagaceae bacterium]
MKRRDFLRQTLPAVALPAFLDGFSLQAWARSPWLEAISGANNTDRVLVLVQLNGGNDGLNTVIPIDLYDAYHAARTNIAIPQDKILRLEGFDKTGLNPAMPHIQQLFNNGKITIVQAVSYPNPNFSHFRATDIWLSGSDSDKILETGWAGRYLEQEYPGFPAEYPNSNMTDPLAIQVGGIVSPALQGSATTMGMAITNPSNFYALLNDNLTFTSASSRAGDQLAYIRQMSMITDKYSTVIKKAAQKVTKQSSLYPAQGKNPLADQLKIVARLIAGGLKTKVYMVNMGGFDTHARQTDAADTTTGIHARLLERLSEAISIFMTDINELGAGNKVLGMTFSEFGRRIKSNASGGTDHGAAAPVFLFGNEVMPGILGNNPEIPDVANVKDNIAMQHDFRSLYTSILKNWFLLSPAESQTVMLKDYESLAIVKKNATAPSI